MQNFSRAERIAAALYFLWFFVHILLFFNSEESQDNSFFWPFIPSGKSMSVTYDVTELVFYLGAPIILFIAYRIVIGNKFEEPQTSRRHSSSFFIAFLDEKIKNEELVQKLNAYQNIPVNHNYLSELKSDREKAASQGVNNWLDRVEVRKKYKEYEN